MSLDSAHYAAYAASIEADLDRLSTDPSVPQPLAEAIRYSLLSGGKRLRGVLLLAACALEDGPLDEALPLACGLEMIHCFSLIHDDLPAMDDDDTRRGRPANHIVYGAGMATLAGDALFSLAFERMLESALRHPASLPRCVQAIAEIAEAAGGRGIAGGQCLDLSSERGQRPWTAALLEEIHLRKTAALFAAPMAAGLRLAGADAAAVEAGRAFGRNLGLAFQILDDLLDVTGDAAVLGKATGADAAHGKLTWPALHGLDAARAEADRRTQAALEALRPFGARAAFLLQTAQDLCARGR